jgi:hypothetical protein
MGGNASREKGKRGERQTVHELAEIFGEQVKRGLTQSRDGAECPDVELPAGVPLWCEVKAHARVNVRAALTQAQEAVDKTNPPFASAPWPVAVCRDTGKPVVAAMYWDHFRALLLRWWSLEQQAAHLAAALDEVTRQAEKDGAR